MNRFRLAGWGLLVGVLMAQCAAAAEHTKDTLETVKAQVEQKKAILVDVRAKGEWDAGHIAGAIFLPITSLRDGVTEEELKALPKDKVIYCYCAVGQRALGAGTILEKHGYTVKPLKPGYKSLVEAGFAKEPK
jgi:phage shock protein E